MKYKNLDDFIKPHYSYFLAILTGRTKNPQLAEDLCQELFFRIAQKGIDWVNALNEPRTYVYGMAKNLHVDWIRKTEKAKFTELKVIKDTGAWSSQVIWFETKDLIEHAALNEQETTILWLIVDEKCTHDEAAERLSISVSKSKRLWQQVRFKVGKRLCKEV
jgi:RNA polymerase sigma factor (sigma-70 family)